MTYDELAKLCGCSVAEARLRAIHLSLQQTHLGALALAAAKGLLNF
jgi:hypothetical protein